MSTEQDEILGYDADHSDARQYCKHGTWIGSWWGPDYMCGACEDGTTDRDYVIGCLKQEIRRQQEAIRRIFPFTPEMLKGMPYLHSFTVFLMDQVDRHLEELTARQEDIVQLQQDLDAHLIHEDEAYFTLILKAWRG
jgi:hypothetical protein